MVAFWPKEALSRGFTDTFDGLGMPSGIWGEGSGRLDYLQCDQVVMGQGCQSLENANGASQPNTTLAIDS